MTATSVEERTERLGWFTCYRSALARPDLRRLFGGLLISATGDWAYNVAPLAFVFDRTRSRSATRHSPPSTGERRIRREVSSLAWRCS